MKLILIVIQIFVIDFSRIQFSDIEIGKPLPKDAIIIIDSSKHLYQITGASDMEPAIVVKEKGIKYTVVLSQEKKVSFVITFDSNFKTEDGFRIGTLYKELKKQYKTKGQFEPGSGYYFKLASGWKALFANEKILHDGRVDDTCRIRSFFKKDRAY